MPDLRYRLDPPELEAQFRADGLPRDRKVASVLVLLVVAFQLVTLPSTLSMLAGRATTEVLAIRGAGIAIEGACLVALRRVQRAPRYDAVVFAWVLSFFVAATLENARLPADYTSFVAWDVLLTVGAYAALPLGLARQAVAASVLAVADLWIAVHDKTFTHVSGSTDAMFAFVAANAVGTITSWELHRRRRREFVALRSEVKAREEAEQAWHELKILRGIIPICANCKNIRTDAGEWQRIETYVREHSEAQFSHGICPSCMRVLYPDIAEGPSGPHGSRSTG